VVACRAALESAAAEAKEGKTVKIQFGRRAAIAAALVILGALIVGTQATAEAATKVRFGTPVRLPTWTTCGGYEPGIAIDKFGNIYVTAHKQNHCLAAAMDPQAPLGVRAQSWLWTSTDGVNFVDMPGLANLLVNPDYLDVGDEGDIALDDANHFYFVDTKVADNHFGRWTVTGKGTSNMTQDFMRPVVPSGELIDDRPWVTAHGSSVVMYAGNSGDKDNYNVGSTAAGCSGPVAPPLPGEKTTGGRYAVFMSYDGGNTFDPVGCTLPDSGWCRPAADHTPGSQTLYMICDNDGGADWEVNTPGDPGFTVGALYSFVSRDNGHTWKRYKIDSYNSSLPADGESGDITWPSVTVARNGYVYALWNDPVSGKDADGDTIKIGSRLKLYRSTDHGKTWRKQDVTPTGAGLIRYSWVDVARDGRIGVGYETHATVDGNWHVYAGISSGWGNTVHYALVDPVEVAPEGDFVFGDFFEVAFDPAGRLNVVYTRCTNLVPGEDWSDCLNSDIIFARSL
jgi:hypothetical protein